MPNTLENLKLWATPIADRVDALQDRGREVWIAGFTPDGRHALVMDGENRTVSVASVASVTSLGRFECPWRDRNESWLLGRFPRR